MGRGERGRRKQVWFSNEWAGSRVWLRAVRGAGSPPGVALSPNSFVMKRDAGYPPGLPSGALPQRSQRALCGPFRPNVAAFVEGVGSGVDTFPGTFERDQQAGGRFPGKAQGWGFPLALLLAQGWLVPPFSTFRSGRIPSKGN